MPHYLVYGDVMLDIAQTVSQREFYDEQCERCYVADAAAKRYPGGAANAAAILAGLVPDCVLLAGDRLPPDSQLHCPFDQLLSGDYIGVPTRTRIYHENRCVLRLDDNRVPEIALAEARTRLAQAVTAALPGSRGVLLSGYKRGTIQPALLKDVTVPIVANVKDPTALCWRQLPPQAVLVCNAGEFDKAFSKRPHDQVAEIAAELGHRLVVTLGEDGAYAGDPATAKCHDVYAPYAHEPPGLVGAGDAFAAALLVELTKGTAFGTAVANACRAATDYVQSPDRRLQPRTYRSVQNYFDWLPAHPGIFTNGCFDRFHAGHKRLLDYAAAKALESNLPLVVAINSDASVRKLKRPPRPYRTYGQRSYDVACYLADHYPTLLVGIFEFAGDVAEALQSRRLQPLCLVKGAEYRDTPIADLPGASLCQGVDFAPMLSGYSTTLLSQP